MYFRLQQKTNILNLDDDYARLDTVLDNGDMIFEFTYSVSQTQAVSRGALRVAVTVDSRNIVKKTLFGQSQRGSVDTAALVNNIRTAVIDAKTATQARSAYRISSRNSDITSFVNNDAISQLRSRVPMSQIQTLNRPRLTLVAASDVKASNDPQPIMHRVANSFAMPDYQQQLSSSLGEDPHALMLEMIVKQGVDPSHVLKLTSRASSEYASHGGLSVTQQAIERTTDPASRLLNFFLFPPIVNAPPLSTDDIADTDFVNVLQTQSSDLVSVPVMVTIPASRMILDGVPVTQVFVTFNLIDSQSNLPVDTVIKVLDVSKHLQVYYTPRVAPDVKFAGSDISSRINLEIKQVDEGATEVQVFKKSIWIASSETDNYTLIGTYPVTSRDQSLLVQVDRPTQSPVVYRVIPRGKQSMVGFEYTNVAIKPSRYSPIRAVALVAVQTDSGIQLQVRHIPANVVAIQLLKWNTTTFDAGYTIVGGDSVFISDDVRVSDIISIVDPDVFVNNVYRYVARLIYNDGNYQDFGNATVEFLRPAPGAVDTQVSNLVVSHDNVPNVTFTLATTTVDTDIDVVKRLLEQLGIDSLFQGDLAAQRDQLKQLIAHAIHRIDITTGAHEYFGVVIVPDFNDAMARGNQAISPLEYGHKYRYEIYPLLRSAETLFDNFVKTSIDPITHRSYTWSPSKYLHPMALTTGTLVSSTGAAQRYAKDPMAFGIIGAVTTIEVSFDSDSAKVVNQTATRFDRQTNVITWKTFGNIDQVDSFLVFKEVHGIRSIIGKAHSEFKDGSCQYVHSVTSHDVGSIKYIIVPITNDYRVGAAAFTNALIVEPQ